MIPISIQKKLEKARQNRKIVVLVTGVFDLLHQEHKTFLYKAGEAGDVLVVGVESDKRVRKLKGDGRPVESQEVRLKKVGELVGDNVFVLSEKFNEKADHLNLIKTIKPDILAVSENSPRISEKKLIMKKVGGKVRVVHKYNPEISTTKIVKNNINE